VQHRQKHLVSILMRKASKDRQQAFPNGIALIGGIALHFRASTELSRPRRPFEPAQSFTELTDIETVTDHGRVNLTHCRPQLDEPRSNVINLTRMIVDDHCELIELAGVIINGHDKLVERPLVPVEPGIDPIEPGIDAIEPGIDAIEPLAVAANGLRHLGQELVDCREVDAVAALHAAKMVQQATAAQQHELSRNAACARAGP
jgi:hypothetical protein